MQKKTKLFTCILLLLILVNFLVGCDRQKKNDQKNLSKTTQLTIWAHAGQEVERKILQEQVARFNLQSPTVDIKLTFIPERDYNAQIQAAAIAGDLPDILEFDGPYLYNYIWQNHLRPLEELLPRQVIDDLIPSIVSQGTYGQHLYSVGVFDSGLGLYARKDKLEEIDIQVPVSLTEAWTVEKFEHILQKLAEKDDDGAVLDLKLNYGGEWFTYGFSPILQSAGADLIEREQYQQSSGTLNNPEAVSAMLHLQSWIQNGYIDPNLDDAAFVSGRVALSWVGHWEYKRYRNAFQEKLALVPLPDFGIGSRTGQGSWNWGITRNCSDPEQAASFLTFLLTPSEVLTMSSANSAVPATRNAINRSELFSEKGPLRLFSEQLLTGASVPRPKTPAYPVITTEFSQAFQHIRNNGDVQEALDIAAARIDQDIRDNKGYPFGTEQ